MKEQTVWKAIALVAVGVLLGMVFERLQSPARAQGSVNSNPDMIAVTGDYGNGTSVLYVIDTKSRNLAVYKSLNGNDVQLVAARKIEYDLHLDEYHDKSAPNCRVDVFAKTWREAGGKRIADGMVPEAESRPSAPGASLASAAHVLRARAAVLAPPGSAAPGSRVRESAPRAP